MINSSIASDDSIAPHGHARPKAVSISPELISQVIKMIEIVGYTIGPALVAFNVFNFNIAKIGFFYKDPARLGIAIGVFLIAAAWYIAKSRK